MKKFSISLALTLITLSSQAQTQSEPFLFDIHANSQMARFILQKQNCLQLLTGDRGEIAGTSYKQALQASIQEINGPIQRALVQLELGCLAHMENPELISRDEKADLITHARY